MVLNDENDVRTFWPFSKCASAGIVLQRVTQVRHISPDLRPNKSFLRPQTCSPKVQRTHAIMSSSYMALERRMKDVKEESKSASVLLTPQHQCHPESPGQLSSPSSLSGNQGLEPARIVVGWAGWLAVCSLRSPKMSYFLAEGRARESEWGGRVAVVVITWLSCGRAAGESGRGCMSSGLSGPWLTDVRCRRELSVCGVARREGGRNVNKRVLFTCCDWGDRSPLLLWLCFLGILSHFIWKSVLCFRDVLFLRWSSWWWRELGKLTTQYEPSGGGRGRESWER